jgi:tetratricopeptide (TPR) repeat protein
MNGRLVVRLLPALISILIAVPISLCGARQADCQVQKGVLESLRRERRLQEAEMRLGELEQQYQAAQDALQAALRELAASKDALDRRAFDALQSGQIGAGLSVLEEKARTRDERATAAVPDRLRRAEEWKQIGAMAFLDSTAHAIEAYERALTFAPTDHEILDRLAWLYERQARAGDRAAMAKRLLGLGDADSRARGLIHLGDIGLNANDGAQARPFLEEAISVARSGKIPRLEAQATVQLAGALLLLNQFREADALLTRALTLTRTLELRYEEGEALYMSAVAAFARGSAGSSGSRDYLRQADQRFVECEEVARKLNDSEIGVAHVLVWRARIARLVGDLQRSETLIRQALAVLERLDVRTRIGFAQQQLAETLVAEGRYREALRYFQSSVESARRAAQPGYEGVALLQWAQAEAAQANMREACRLATDSAAAFSRAPGTAERDRARRTAEQYCRPAVDAIAQYTGGDIGSAGFRVHRREVPSGFEEVWTRATALLAKGKERMFVSNKGRGVLVTSLTRHGPIGFPRYDKYCIVIEEVSDRTTRIVLKLLSYSNTNEKIGREPVLVPVGPQIVERVASTFLDRLTK